MVSPVVRTINGSYANVQGTQAAQRMLAKIPDAMKARIQPALDYFAASIVETFKEIAPVAPEFEAHPGQMRDSARAVTTGRELSASVVVDAKDAKGDAYPAHVEYGHKTKAGGHVPAKPAFWPAYQANKKKGRAGVARAIKLGVKDVAP